MREASKIEYYAVSGYGSWVFFFVLLRSVKLYINGLCICICADTIFQYNLLKTNKSVITKPFALIRYGWVLLK